MTINHQQHPFYRLVSRDSPVLDYDNPQWLLASIIPQVIITQQEVQQPLLKSRPSEVLSIGWQRQDPRDQLPQRADVFQDLGEVRDARLVHSVDPT